MTALAPATTTAASATAALVVPVATATATAAMTTATATAAMTATSSAAAAFFRFADAERPSTQVGAIEILDHRFTGLAVLESDEGEASRALRLSVQGHVNVFEGLVVNEELAEIGFGRVVGKVPDIQFHFLSLHVGSTSVRLSVNVSQDRKGPRSNDKENPEPGRNLTARSFRNRSSQPEFPSFPASPDRHQM